jgi:hypothetical protein
MTRESCLQGATPPKLTEGVVLREGRFFRNLRHDDVGRCFENDKANPPEYGWKVKRQHWKEAGQQEGGLSVNFVPCIHTPACSLEIDSVAGKHVHVVEIDLVGLATLTGTAMVAMYLPTADQVPNPCHFEILSEDRPLVESLMLIHDAMRIDTGKNIPKVRKSLDKALSAITRYHSVFVIHRSPIEG